MNKLFLIGVSHKTAPVEWRERLAIPEGAFAPLMEGLRGGGFPEAVLLSTCNRVELYAAGDEGAEAVKHLFRVAAGLDSLVVGESEILGQVKKAYEAAGAASSTGKLTNVLFQRALFVGKRARAETAISEGPTSVPALAASLAGR